jgi:hypothetical protein
MPNPNPPQFADTGKSYEPAKRNVASADQHYIDAVFDHYRPKKTHFLFGTCIEYREPFREIKVALDIVKSSSSASLFPVDIYAHWGRPRLTEREVVDHRVKLYIQREKKNGIESVKDIILSDVDPKEY